MKNTRCEEMVVQLVVRTYDNVGRPVNELVTAPVKVFRNAQTLDFWTHVDETVAALMKQQAAASAPPPPAPDAPPATPKKGGKRR